jgi:hypothetical protein
VDVLADEGADQPPTPPADGAVVRVLIPVADPMLRTHGVSRSPEYRLKLVLKAALRGFGFRAKVVRDPTAGEIRQAGVP